MNLTSIRTFDLSSRGVIEKSIYWNSTKVLLFTGFKGLSIKLNKPLLDLVYYLPALFFMRSRFDLYDEQNRLIGADECSTENLEHREIRYFGNLDTTTVEIRLNSVILERPICPYLFKNANISQLNLADFGQSYLVRNIPIFYEINNINNMSINLNITLNILKLSNLNHLRLTRQSLDEHVFGKTFEFNLNGILAHIETDFFRTFKALFTFDLFLENAGEFFQSSNNEWLAQVYSQYESFPTREKMLSKLYEGKYYKQFLKWHFSQALTHVYMFPDEDFCLFKHFPWFKPILAAYDTSDQIDYITLNSDTCTMRFLMQTNENIRMYMRTQGYLVDIVRYNDSMLAKCNFTQRLEICFNTHTQIRYSKLDSYVDYLNILYVFDWLEFLGPIVSFPIFSLIAFILNLLVILIIRSKKNKKEKLFEANSFRLIKLNSAFNCVECLIYEFRLMGLCLGTNSVFCSSIKNYLFVSYFESFDRYLSEVMKTCSILTGLLFSIQRYQETSQKEYRMIKVLLDLETKWVCSVILTWGFVVTVPYIFEMRIGNASEFYDTPVAFNLNILLYSQQMLRTLFYFLYYLTNDLLILMINLIVDICLVHRIRQNLKKKLSNKQTTKPPGQLDEHERKKLKKEKKKKASVERKANAMIIISVLIYVFCRLPELTGVFFLYYFPRIRQSCDATIICYLLTNVIEYLYMLSYMFNIFIYYKFNSCFQKGFRNFFNLKTIRNK